MKKCLCAVFVAALAVSICLLAKSCRENESLRMRISELERTHLSAVTEMYAPPWEFPSAEEACDLTSIFKDIVVAYTNEDLRAMRKCISCLPRIYYRLQWQAANGFETHFLGVLNDSFLRIKKLRDFSCVEDFDRYAEISLAAARFYGESDLRRNCFDFPIAVEYLALKVLQQYKEKFLAEGRKDLADAADRHIDEWKTRIDSADGLTRQCAWLCLKYNTVYIRALRPERAMTDAEGRVQARQYVRGLLSNGYRPRWLEDEFPCSEEQKRILEQGLK